MKEWNDFYLAVASASAALTGLIFVGVSINLTKILSIKGLVDRALLSILLLLTVLVLSILFLVPALTTQTAGTAVLVIGILSWLFIFRLDLNNLQNKQKQHRRQYLFNMLIDQLATVCFIITGIAMTAGWPMGTYWIVPAILISVVKAVFDGWALLVEINR
ncbi:hypothetical protein [Fibrella aquatilis]|uniref:Modulator of FtsH protease n=1 Tax=Fibrella aquatilis TaxID=2817059 RepID=A0A939FZV1_9BACT|nr:hypothetical protein [Fibrella aquatilis]MBO0929374.1 hypothetical protein [Fibrella aquatilis]